jgi:hypothetical protein
MDIVVCLGASLVSASMQPLPLLAQINVDHAILTSTNKKSFARNYAVVIIERFRTIASLQSDMYTSLGTMIRLFRRANASRQIEQLPAMTVYKNCSRQKNSAMKLMFRRV